jgi:hypothetical protein
MRYRPEAFTRLSPKEKRSLNDSTSSPSQEKSIK